MHVISGILLGEIIMEIQKSYFKNDTVYGNLFGDPVNGTVGCGFLFKPDASYSQTLCFEYYGAFYLLSGKGVYRDADGTAYPLTAGDYVQRLPHRSHSTEIVLQETGLNFLSVLEKRRMSISLICSFSPAVP